jgi:hypothetical protein
VVSDADKNLYVQLSEPFGSDMIRKHPSKGVAYAPGAEVVARLNRVLGVYGWEWLITARWTSGEIGTPETGVYPAWVMVEGVLSINDTFDPPRSVKVSGVGGQQVKMLSNGKGPVDLGDEWKGAATDALKKACMHRGVALDLARKEEALAAELAMSAVPADPVVIAWIGAAFAGMPEADRGRAKWDYNEIFGVPGALTKPQEGDAIRFVEFATGVAWDTPAAAPVRPAEPDSGGDGTDSPPAPPKAVEALRATVEALSPSAQEAFNEWAADVIPDMDKLTVDQYDAAATFLGL